MFDKLKKFIAYLSAYKNFDNTLLVFSRKTMFDMEQEIQHLDSKRKAKMSDDKLAKEMLLYNDCYIIPKEELKSYITKG